MSRYPKDWKLIATFVKNQANWKCAKCGRQFEKGNRHLQVHHIE
jgi:PHP family Zn ribbon phosphoesterase